MLTRIYQWMLKLTSKPTEKGEYSGGYLQDRVRKEALILCRHAQGKLLEIGCGEGLFLAQIIKQNPRLLLWGIDNDATRLKAAALRSGNANLSLQDALGLSFENEYFDTVICINVLFNLNSIQEVKRTLENMKRVCRRNGSLIFDFRNSLNPFLVLKYRLAKYYDLTLQGLPLKTYTLNELESILNQLNMVAVKKRFIGFGRGLLATSIVIEAKQIC